MAKEDGYLKIRIPSDELHGRLGIGIPKSSLMLMEGENGAGKSIIAQRFIIAFLRNGASVTYISTELTSRDLIIQMESMDYSVNSYLLNGQLTFIPMFPRLGKTVPSNDFFSRMMQQEELFKSDAIVIDSMSPLISETYSSEDYFEIIRFFKALTGMSKVIILTANPDFIDKNLLTILESTCDIHFNFFIKQIGGSIKRFIEVRRFKRCSMQVGDLVGFRVEPGVGFVVEISSVM